MIRSIFVAAILTSQPISPVSDLAQGGGYVSGAGVVRDDLDLDTHKLYGDKSADPDTYCYRAAADTWRCVVGGVSVLDCTASGCTVAGELAGVTSLDATTEATIEAAIDTLANLASVQGQTVTLAGALDVESGGCTCNQDVTSDASPTFAGLTLAGDLDLQDSYDVTNAVEVQLDYATYEIPSTLEPDGTTQTIDWTHSIQKLDLGSATGDVTITWSNATAGRHLYLFPIQAATARDITWPATVKWPYGGSAPTLSTGEDEIDIIFCVSDGTNEFCSVAGQDYE